MKPETRKTEYEKVICGEYVKGTISDIKYDLEHKFSYQGQEKIAPAVRLIFDLEGCQFPHGTRWLTFTYGEKSNLYGKYLIKLVEGATPDMDFDIEAIKGMPVRTIWAEKNNFQFIELINPLGEKIPVTATPEELPEIELGEISDNV